MAATIRGTFELVDRASGTLKSIERQALKTQAAVVGVGAALDAQDKKSQKASAGLSSQSRALNTFQSDLKDARKDVTSLGAAQDDLGRKLDRTNTSMAGSNRSVSSWSRAVKDANAAWTGLGHAFTAVKFTAIAAVIQPAIASIDALGGGLIALVPKIVQAGQAMYALPAAVSTMAQALGTLKLGFSGVGQALGQALSMQQNYSQNQPQFAQQVVQATNAVKDAQIGLSDAFYAQQQAQVQLTLARRDAVRELQDMEFASRTSILQEARAGLGIQQARLTLQQAMAAPGTSQLTLESDRLAVLEAQASAQQTHTQAVRARQDATRAEKRDPTSSPTMKLAQAQHTLVTSSQEVTRSQRSLQSAQAELNLLVKNGNAGTNAYRKALLALSPSARQFVQFLKGSTSGGGKSILDQMNALKESAGKGLFGPLEAGIRGFSGSWRSLDKVTEQTGGALGRSLQGILKVFSDPHWITQVGGENAKIIGIVGQGFTALARALKQVILAGQPFVEWVARVFRGWAEHRADVDNTAKGFDHLQDRMRKAESAIKQIFAVGKNLWDTLRNIGHAATGLGDSMWDGAVKGTAAWSKWTHSMTGQNDMRRYFDNLLPTLQSMRRFVDDLARAFVHLGAPGQGGQAGAQMLFNTLDKMIPATTIIVKNLSALLPAVATISRSFAGVLRLVTDVGAWLLRWKPLAYAVGAMFAVGVVTKFFSRMTKGLRDAKKGFGDLHDIWSRMTGGGGRQRSPGAGADPLSKLSLSEQWGVRSGDGPGSIVNPMMVRVEGGSALGGGSPFGGKPTGGALQKAETAGADVTKSEQALGTGEEVVGGAAGANALSKFAGVGGKALEFGSKALGPIGLGLAALPGVLAFANSKGSTNDRLRNAGSALLSSATLGIVNLPGAATKAHQVAQGTSRADQEFRKFQSSGGVLTAAGTAQYRQRIATLQSQYKAAQGHSQVTGLNGMTSMVGANPAVAQDRMANIRRLEADFAAQQTNAGGAAANSWSAAFGEGIQKGEKPQQAMNGLMNGLALETTKLGPAGQKAMFTAMASWGQTIVANNPKMQGPIDDLNQYIVNSFQGMGQNVEVVNGQILTGSQQQWQGVYKALTDPMSKALEKLNGTFGQIRQKAIGELMAMGYSKNDATTLVGLAGQNHISAGWLKAESKAASASDTSKAGFASGGRVAGNNRRDVYQFGDNMLGGGELVVNRHQEQDANARLMRHGEPTLGSIVSNRKTPNWFASGGRAQGGGYSGPSGSVILDSGVNMSVNQEPQILQDLRSLAGELRKTVYVISGYRSPAHSVAVGGFADDPHTKGEAADIGVGAPLLNSMFGVTAAQLAAVGLYRPFYPASAHEVNHVQLLAGGASGTGGPFTGGTGATGGGAPSASQIKAIRANPILGVGGIPLVLAQTAANAVASNLTGGLNKKLGQAGGGMNFAGVKGLGGTAAQNEALGRRMMMAAGWSASQWPALQALWTQESGWNANSVNSSSGAYGIPQSLGHGHPYNLGDARAQIAWGLNYIKGRYGSPDAAEAHERAFNWYSGGGRVKSAGWFARGGSFVTNGPTVFGAGESGKERVTVEPAGGGGRPISIQIDKIEVNRKGDVQRIVDEELKLLALSLDRS